MANIAHSDESMRVIHANKEFNQQVFAVCCSILTLAPAIAAIIIGLQYDEYSPCNDATNYFIELKMYLLMAGIVSIGWTCLSFIIICISSCCCPNYQRAKCPSMFVAVFSIPLLLWSFLWALFGMYMYFEQMSTVCQNQPIGEMLFAWCVVQLFFVGVALCGLSAICGESICAKM
eukprot:522162_1